MNPHRTQFIIIILLVCFVLGSAAAAPLEFSELSLLVRAHEPEASIMADASHRKLVRSLTPDQEATLKAQGASESLIRSLHDPSLVLSQADLAAYNRSRSAVERTVESHNGSGYELARRPSIEIVNVGLGHPINLSFWGGPDYDFVFSAPDLVDIGPAEVEMIHPGGTVVHSATYHGVRVPGWEPVDPEYTSIMSHTYSRPIAIDWSSPVRMEDVPYTLYPVYAAGHTALFYVGRATSDSVTVAVVTR